MVKTKSVYLYYEILSSVSGNLLLINTFYALFFLGKLSVIGYAKCCNCNSISVATCGFFKILSFTIALFSNFSRSEICGRPYPLKLYLGYFNLWRLPADTSRSADLSSRCYSRFLANSHDLTPRQHILTPGHNLVTRLYKFKGLAIKESIA